MGDLTFNEDEGFKRPPSYHKEKSKLADILYRFGFGQRISPQIIAIVAIILSLATVVAIYDVSRDMLDNKKAHDIKIKSYLPEDF